ncbi:MAG: acyl--CoA ligase [Betaproteobacteria bacterium]|nr:acyl--CoA ligase [Betaproteobacteria bacterium]
MNIGSLLARHARCRPDHTAVIFEDQRLTWREFNSRVNRTANALLNLGVRKGDKVAVILGNSLELLEIYWAVAKMGAVVVPLSQLTRGAGLASLIKASDAVLVITDSHFTEHVEPLRKELSVASDRYLLADGTRVAGYRSYAELTAAASDAEPGVEISDTDPYNVMFTSGTTGDPKGIVHTHYIRSMYCTLIAMSYRITPESVVAHAGSLVFNGAFVTLMPAVFCGATYVLERSFNAGRLIDVIRREKVTHIQLVPSQIIAMMATGRFNRENLGSLELLSSLGAPLHLEHKEELIRQLPGRFYELYGLTEGFVTILDKHDVARKPGSVGVPPPFFEMRIVKEDGGDAAPGETGEIVGRGPILMPGYYRRPDLTAQAIDQNGWLRTGDMGYVDEDGFLYLVDRKKDLIISGGVNVFPRDIEEIVVQHPAVREAAVFGIPHDKWGETPIACVILRDPGAASSAEIKDWVNQRVGARYQQVSEVVIMEDFPRNTAGKTLKRQMREPYWAGRKTLI